VVFRTTRTVGLVDRWRAVADEGFLGEAVRESGIDTSIVL
jgi:hypothetical protein